MILVLLDHFYVCGWIFLLCSVSEDVVKCPRSKVVGSRGWIVYVQMKTGTFCVWRTSHSRFGFHSFSSCFGSWLWGCKDTKFNGWEQPPSCWPPLHFTLYLELSIVSSCQGGPGPLQWWTSDRVLGACPFGRGSECYWNKYTIANCVCHGEKTPERVYYLEKNGSMDQGVGSDEDVGKGLYEQVAWKAT